MGNFSYSKNIKIYELKQYPYSIHKWRTIAEFHPVNEREPISASWRLSINDPGFEKSVIRYRAEYLTGDSVYFPKWNDAQIEISPNIWSFQYNQDEKTLKEEIAQYCHDIRTYRYELRNSRYKEEVSWQGISND